jgi:glycosyltransferase involved in cell wall biosynthesis
MKIVQYIKGAAGWGEVGPDAIDRGLGGRETALINLSREWTADGHEVVNFVPRQKAYRHWRQGTFVATEHYLQHMEDFGADAVVAWEAPYALADKRIVENCNASVVEMQVADVHLEEDQEQFVDRWAVLSDWAGEYLASRTPALTPSKLVTLKNGVDTNRFPTATAKEFPKPPFNFFYSSSPDRGLKHFKHLWPEITKKYPGSKLRVAYGVETWLGNSRMLHRAMAEDAREVEEVLRMDGVEYQGKMGQRDLAKMMIASDALLYPCDTVQPTETGCITVVEAAAAGCPMVLTDADCLESEYTDKGAEVVELPLDAAGRQRYLTAIETLMEDEERYKMRQAQGAELVKERDWNKIALDWTLMLKEACAA